MEHLLASTRPTKWISLSLKWCVWKGGIYLILTWKPIFRCLIVCKKMAQVLLRTGFPTHTIHYSQAQSCKALPRVQTSSQLGNLLSWRTECYIGCWWHSEECLYCHNLLLCDGIIKGLKDGILRGGNLMKFGYMIYCDVISWFHMLNFGAAGCAEVVTGHFYRHQQRQNWKIAAM